MSRPTVMIQSNFRNRAAGFGLIEVLAAVLVLAVGVVGFAALQLRAVQTSSDSYYRTQAMSIAQDLAERARVNNSQLATYLTATTWTGTLAPSDCVAGNCTASQMAVFDANSVRTSASTLLPQGLVNMEACKVGTLNCIYVSWDGLQPTAGATGQCVTATGGYASPPANKPAISCVMLEVQ